MYIKVTQEDINNGQCGSPRRCMVARAIHRYLPKATVDVTRFAIISIDGKENSVPLSSRVVNFIYDYDNGRTVKPFKFFLKLPENLLK